MEENKRGGKDGKGKGMQRKREEIKGGKRRERKRDETREERRGKKKKRGDEMR